MDMKRASMDEAPITAPAAADNSVPDPRLVGRWLTIFILVGLVWRLLRFGVAMPVWGDEAKLGLNVIDRSYRALLQPLDYVQVAPLGFFWALRLTFMHLGISDFTS